MSATYRLDLPWSRPPLSLNDRPNRWAKARATKDIRTTTAWLAKTATPRPAGASGLRVELHYQPRDNRARDDDNPVPTLKACVDGLVDAGWVADDSRRHVRRGMPVIHDAVRGEPGRLWLEVTVLDAAVST